jgi:two-component system chemotaxis response regulator CheY
MKVLIVDDSRTMLRIIKNTLNRLGYDDVVEAENGQDALDKFQEGEFGMVLTDWNMPVMDGLTLVRNVSTGSHPDDNNRM